MLKVMTFIDGTWLYRGREYLREKIKDPNISIDYGKLPHALADKLARQLGFSDVDLVRTCIFYSLPENVDPRDVNLIEDQEDFYDRLKEDFHYETEPFYIDFKRRRLLKKDRDAKDSFHPEEKCVDIALASSMLYYAAIPYAYDAAIAVIGDEDYVPVLQHVRRLGKRVMIASIHGSCSDVYDPIKDPTDSRRVRDVDTIFLDDIVPEIVLEYPLRELECQSPLHKGKRTIWTREQPRKGRPYYCEECREAYSRQRSEAEAMLEKEYPEELLSNLLDGYRAGRIGKIFRDKGYGFIRSMDKKDYWFHAKNVCDAEFSSLAELQYVQFKIKTEANLDTRGDVHELRPLRKS